MLLQQIPPPPSAILHSVLSRTHYLDIHALDIYALDTYALLLQTMMFQSQPLPTVEIIVNPLLQIGKDITINETSHNYL